jgi:hypothetical protein
MFSGSTPPPAVSGLGLQPHDQASEVVALEIVWDVVRNKLPVLEERVRRILKEEE